MVWWIQIFGLRPLLLGTEDVHAIRAWAAEVTDSIAYVPLQMQPVLLSMPMARIVG